eukprot:scaffold29477_cov111-Skeletonema_dohrnii-CCMP3373.AAC.1
MRCDILTNPVLKSKDEKLDATSCQDERIVRDQEKAMKHSSPFMPHLQSPAQAPSQSTIALSMSDEQNPRRVTFACDNVDADANRRWHSIQEFRSRSRLDSAQMGQIQIIDDDK